MILVEQSGIGAVHLAAVNYYRRLLSNEDHIVDMSLIDLIPSCVSNEENALLLIPFSLEEVRVAVYTPLLDAAPGIDGFSMAFFTSNWNIIHDDILAAMNELLTVEVLPDFLVHTAIVFIPKKRVTESLGDFHPISLCSMVYKIFAKLLCNRLASLLPSSCPSTKELSLGAAPYLTTYCSYKRSLGKLGSLAVLLIWPSLLICVKPMTI